MNSSEAMDKLCPALKAAQAGFKRVGKSGENTYDRYKYATLEDYVDSIREALAEHGFSILSSVEDVVRLDARTTKNGGIEHAVQVQLRVRLIHESGQWIEACGFGEGQDRADKAIYKAVTGARKYALASMLNLATTDDPERDESVGQAEAPRNGSGKGRRSFEPDKAKGGTNPDADAIAKATDTIRKLLAEDQLTDAEIDQEMQSIADQCGEDLNLWRTMYRAMKQARSEKEGAAANASA
jgi:hypothetical protein